MVSTRAWNGSRRLCERLVGTRSNEPVLDFFQLLGRAFCVLYRLGDGDWPFFHTIIFQLLTKWNLYMCGGVYNVGGEQVNEWAGG
jgi:hypothetical protein